MLPTHARTACPSSKKRTWPKRAGGELAGPAIKAAITRACAPWIRDLCQQYCTSDTDEDRSVRQLTEALVEFYHILYTEGIFITDEGLAHLGIVTERFGCMYMRLREHARRGG